VAALDAGGRIAQAVTDSGSNAMAYVPILPALCDYEVRTSSSETDEISHLCAKFRNDRVMIPPLRLNVVFLAVYRPLSAYYIISLDWLHFHPLGYFSV
jgi:hypothetical protein